MDSIEFTALLDRRASNVKRWHNKAVLQVENIAEHQFYVAYTGYVIASILAAREWTISPPTVMLFGLLHDMPEIITGDTPSPVKRMYETWFDSIEEDAHRDLFPALGLGEIRRVVDNVVAQRSSDSDDDLRYEREVVRVADRMAALAFLIGEEARGNTLRARSTRLAAQSVLDLGESLDWWHSLSCAIPDMVASLTALAVETDE